MLAVYLAILDEAHFEVQEAFKGLADDNVWKRPATGLLSIGEIAGHIAYWEVIKFAYDAGPDPDIALLELTSPLIDRRFRYYTTALDLSPSPEHLSLSAAEVYAEVVRLHEESITRFQTRNPDLDSRPPGFGPNATYRAFLSYAPIHVAYHTGQIYSARHVLGELPPDN